MTDPAVKEREPSYQESFTPVPEAPAPEPETFSSNIDGLSAAANELNSHRELETPPVVREYQHTHGEHRGERRPLNETIDIDRAAKDLADLRRAEADAQEVLGNLARQKEIDANRAEGIQAQLDQLEGLPPVEARQPEAQPQAQPVPADGVHPDVRAALENPHVRQAIQQQIGASETARQEYMNAAAAFIQLQNASLLSNFEELRGATRENLPGIIKAVQVRDPARAAEMVKHIETTMTMVAQAQQHQQFEHQRAQHEAQTWMNQQDQAFETFARSRPEAEVKEVRGAVADVLATEYGIDRNALAQLWNTSPLLRSEPVQKLLYNLTRYHLAQQNIRKAPMPNRKVMRPGDVSIGHDYSELTQKMRDFAADSTPRKGAAALMARRRAAANR
jgi:hypothetical protein